MTVRDMCSPLPPATEKESWSQCRGRLLWPLLVVLYGTFLWRNPYSLKSLPLYVLDWLAPLIGLGTWLTGRWLRREDWPRTALDAPLLAWCAAVSLGTVFSVHRRNSLYGTWEAFTWVLILWLLVDALRRGWKRVLWQVTYLVSGVVCLLGAVEFLAWYLGWPLLPSFQQGWPAVGGLSNPFPPTLYRLSFTLVHPTVLSGYVALLIPPAIGILAATRHRDTRLGMGLWLTGAALVLFLSLSRGGFLALGGSLPFLLVGAARSPALRRWWIFGNAKESRSWWLRLGPVLLSVAVGLGVLWASRLAEHRSGDAVRMDLWRSALEMFRDHPLTGVGPAAFGCELRAYRQPLLARDHVSTAHNLYLNTAAEMGMPGVLALAWLLVALARSWWRRWRALAPGSPAWWQCLSIGAALAGLAAQSLVDTFVEPAILLPATFFMALLLAPQPPASTTAERARRWPWIVALAILAPGAVGSAWDDWGAASFERSLAWTQRGEVEKALSFVEQARSHDPGMPLYACQAGYLYGLRAAAGDEEALTTAQERYRDCLAHFPVPGWVDQLNRATLLWAAGQQAEARAAVAQAVAQTPLEWMPWLNQGFWAERMGDQPEAVSSYGWVLALDPELAGSPFWQQGERAAWWDEIVAAGEQAASRLGNDPIRWRWQAAIAAGQWDTVVRQAEAWLQAHPADPEAMAWLGEAWLGLGRPTEAWVWLDRAITAQPGRARSYLARGRAALALGRHADAERDFRTALFLEPGQRAHLELARLARQAGQVERASHEYSRALRGLTVVHAYDLVLFNRMAWPMPLPQAIRIGYRADGEVALEWGELLEQQGDLATARQVYAATLSLDPFLTEVRQRLMDQRGGDDLKISIPSLP